MRIKRIVILLTALAVLLAAGSCRQPFETFLSNHGFLTFDLLAAMNSSVLSTDVRGNVLPEIVNLYVPPGTDRTNLIPSFTFLGQQVRVGTEAQVSGETAHDFSSPVDYIVTAWNGLETTYTVSVLDIPPRVWARSLVSIPSEFETVSAIFNDVVVDTNGNIYAVGYQGGMYAAGGEFGYDEGVSLGGPVNATNAVIVKYSTNGAVLWARTVETGPDDSCFNSVAVDSFGNIYAAGYQYGDGTYSYGNGKLVAGSANEIGFTAQSPAKNPVLVKYAASGTVLWARSISGTSPIDSQGEFMALAVDGLNNIYAAGYQNDTMEYTYNGASVSGVSSSMNAVLVKYDSYGNGVWAGSTFAGSFISPTAGNSIFESVQADDDGTVYTAGYQDVPPASNGTAFYYASDDGALSMGADDSNNAMLVGYDGELGTAQWATAVEHSTTSCDSYFWDISLSDGYLYAVGDMAVDSAYTGDFYFGNDIVVNGGSGLDIESGRSYALLVQYDSYGGALGVRYPDSSPSNSSFRGVSVDPSGIIHAAGYQNLNSLYTYGVDVSVAGGAESTHNAVLVSYDDNLGPAQEALSVSCSQSGISDYAAVATDSGGHVFVAGSIYGSGDPITYGFPTFYEESAEATGANGDGANVALIKYGALP